MFLGVLIGHPPVWGPAFGVSTKCFLFNIDPHPAEIIVFVIVLVVYKEQDTRLRIIPLPYSIKRG